MSNNKVTGLGTPTAATDAATKGYADSILGSSTAAATSATAAANSAAAAYQVRMQRQVMRLRPNQQSLHHNSF